MIVFYPCLRFVVDFGLILPVDDLETGGDEGDEMTSLPHSAPPNGGHSISPHLTTVMHFLFSDSLSSFRFLSTFVVLFILIA